MPMFSPELWLRTLLEALPLPPLAWFSSGLPLWRKIAPGLLAAGLCLFTSACGRNPAEVDNCGDISGRPGYEPVGEYFYTTWGSNNRLAVVHIPKDSTGRYLY
ncbi:MAG TPA: hypothetical protein VFG50_14400, partial [Rhodothermales bacterium]|nr:hypothetical protein [Rhodothermales bacterium]